MIYKVKKGNHWFRPLKPKIHFGIKQLTKVVKFSPECTTDIGYSQINKLFGFSTDPFNLDSFRIGWTPYKDKIALHGYIHEDNRWKRELVPSLIGVFETNKNIICSISLVKEQVFFTAYSDNKIGSLVFSTAKTNTFLFGWMMNNYYGGAKTAPNDMWIEMEEINEDKNSSTK